MPDGEKPPAFAFEGHWPFGGTPEVAGHPMVACSGFIVTADPDGIPVVTLTLVGEGPLALILGHGAAKVQVSDESAEGLISLGWKPPDR